ncbi:MAG: hypothetical protein ACO3FK_12785, partial [Vulcanococcus sp.]
QVVLVDGVDIQAAAARLSTVVLDRQFPGLRAQPPETAKLLNLVMQKPMQCVGALQAEFPPDRADHIALTLVWLMKLGVVVCLAPLA